MSNWAYFWICVIAYFAIKYVFDKLTYNRNKAIKELAKEQCGKAIKAEMKKSKSKIRSYLVKLGDNVADLIDALSESEYDNK